jgi:hypothetical protein
MACPPANDAAKDWKLRTFVVNSTAAPFRLIF